MPRKLHEISQLWDIAMHLLLNVDADYFYTYFAPGLFI